MPRPELWRVTWPAPSNRLPSQWVVALRVVAMPRESWQTDAARQNGRVSTFYDEIGGYETIRRIVARFYEGVATDPVLRPLYPEEDLGPAEERFRLFLVQYWGGPTTYSDTRGHPRLRMRHAPFAVTPSGQGALAHPLPRRPRRGSRADPGAGRAVLGLRHPRRAVHGEHLRRRGLRNLSTRCNAPGLPRQERVTGRTSALDPETGADGARPAVAPPALPSGSPLSEEGRTPCCRT